MLQLIKVTYFLQIKKLSPKTVAMVMVIKKIDTIWELYEYSVNQCFTLTLHFEENGKFAFFIMKSITLG